MEIHEMRNIILTILKMSIIIYDVKFCGNEYMSVLFLHKKTK